MAEHMSYIFAQLPFRNTFSLSLQHRPDLQGSCLDMLWYTRLLVRRPCVVFWVSLTLVIVLCVIPFVAMDNFLRDGIDFTVDEFSAVGNDIANKHRAIQLAKDYWESGAWTRSSNDLNANANAVAVSHATHRTLQASPAAYTGTNLNVWFAARDRGNLFTASRIAQAVELQTRLLALEDVYAVHISTVSALAGLPEAELQEQVLMIASAIAVGDYGEVPYWYGGCLPGQLRPGRYVCTPSDGLEPQQTRLGSQDPEDYFAADFSKCNPSSEVIMVRVEVSTPHVPGPPAGRPSVARNASGCGPDTNRMTGTAFPA